MARLTTSSSNECLGRFARFVRDAHLDALAALNLRLAREMETPLLSLVGHLSEDELQALTVAGLEKLLTDLVTGDEGASIAEALRQWENDELPGIPKDALEPSDLVLVHAAQKQALLSFLPAYTQDVEVAMRVVRELESYYTRLQDAAFALFLRLREATERAIAESRRVLEAELEQATAELSVADRHKDEFLAVLSHELRTPLNFITAYASLLDDEVQGPLEPAQHESLGKILEGADRMLSLVESLLDYSSLRAGKFTLLLEPVAMDALLQAAVEALKPSAEAKHLRVAATCEPGKAVVDGRRIQHALGHLLDNAVKFTPVGGQIGVRAHRSDDAWIIAVSDTGPGIPDDHHGAIFKHFTQLDMSTTRQTGGIGLGLAISKAIVEAHGGSIQVESRPGTGSTFTVRLPI